jgi:pimeloyl-ACP methyl ester carboxylesterase
MNGFFAALLSATSSQPSPPQPDWWLATFPQGRQTLTIQDANDRPVAIAYGEKGSGQPLVLIHGVASWSYCWRFNIDALAQHFRVICFDAKNSGFSEKPPYPERSDHKIVELERVVTALCDRPPMLVAESLGALVALAMIQARPGLIDRLVVLNAPVFVERLPHWGMQLLADIPLAWVEFLDRYRVAQQLAPVIRPIVYAARAEVAASGDHITPEYVHWITYPHLYLPGTLTKLAEEFQLAAREIQRQERRQPNLIRAVQENLEQVTCPSLVLWSEFDRWFPLSHGVQLAAQLPNAQFQIIPNCGHYAAGGNPEFVNAAVLSFLCEETTLSPA